MSNSWEYLRETPPKRQVSPSPQKEKRDRLDIMQQIIASTSTGEEIENWLNELGADRWELVAIDGIAYVFKRPKS